MSAHPTRTTILIASVVIVGALVLVDQLNAKGDAAQSTPTVRAEYEQQAELVARMKQFIDSAPMWRAADDAAQNAWNAIEPRLIIAPTAQLANGGLQQRITRIVADLGVTLNSSSAPKASTPVENLSLRVIGVTISIETSSPQQLYSFVDRLENMTDAWTHIRRLQIMGPGRTPSAGLNIEIELEALAWITQGVGDAQ